MSLRLSLLNVAAGLLARRSPTSEPTPEAARRDFARLTSWFLFGPKGVERQTARLGSVAALDLRPLGGGKGSLILYFHGGGYVVGSPETHRKMLSRLALLTGTRVVVPDYRLAPENPAPAAFEDAVAVWAALTASGIAPDRIVLGGDSAGGGLALALLAHLAGEGTPPAATFVFSPWTDLTLSGASMSENAGRDRFLQVARIKELARRVLGGGDPSDPRISPLFADFTGASPVYIQLSDREILLDDGLRIAERLARQGVQVHTDRWADTPHVWQLLDGWLPEAREALRLTAAFVRDSLRVAPPRSGS